VRRAGGGAGVTEMMTPDVSWTAESLDLNKSTVTRSPIDDPDHDQSYGEECTYRIGRRQGEPLKILSNHGREDPGRPALSRSDLIPNSSGHDPQPWL